MDEPFAALDEITRHKLNDDLLALWEAAALHRGLRHPFGVRVRLPVAAHRGDGGAARAASWPTSTVDAPYPRDDLFRTSADYAQLCRVASEALQAGDRAHERRTRPTAAVAA